MSEGVHPHHRPEVLRDAATIMDALKTDDYLTHKEVAQLNECYKQNSCDPQIMDVLRKYDTSKDGVLDMEELAPVLDGSQIVCDLRKVLEVYDTDHDGKLSEAELQKIVRDYAEKKAGAEVGEKKNCGSRGVDTGPVGFEPRWHFRRGVFYFCALYPVENSFSSVLLFHPSLSLLSFLPSPPHRASSKHSSTT
jgi:hypothetical protein